MAPRYAYWLTPLAAALLCSGIAAAQAPSSSATANPPAPPQAAQQQAVPPPKHALTEKERKKQQQALEKELNPEDKKWLNEDVAYIITDEERQAFLQLQNEDEREAFIENFWRRRNPDPDSPYNSYKEDYYRRFAYANQHFGSGVPGWKTDRGRIYITWGKPDVEDDHDGGGPYDRSFEEGGGSTTVYPFEDWTYNYLPGIGTNIKLEFVDTCQCGEFHLTIDPGEKDALLHVPGAGLTLGESFGDVSKSDRFNRMDGTTQPADTLVTASTNEFSRIETLAKVFAPPKIEYKDLAAVVDHNINYSLLPFQYRTDFVKITDDTVLVPITLQVAYRNITLKDNNSVEQGKIEVYGRITTITGRLVDQWTNTGTVNVPSELLPTVVNKSARYWHGALLKPGRYKVNLVIKDANSPDKMGTRAYAIVVPAYKDSQLSSSSIILADSIEKVPAKNVGTGEFILGDTKVDPVMGGIGSPAQFKQNQSLGIWLQIYNLQTDKITHKPSATIKYVIEDLATLKDVLVHTETSADMSNAADQLTIEKTLPLASLPPSTYRLTISVTDDLGHQTISPQTNFIILQ